MDQQEIVKTLGALRTELAERFDAKEISLFGSFVRGEQDVASDIDVLVESGTEATFFDLVRLGLFLEETFQRPVDVIPKESLRPEFREEVLWEQILI